MSMYLSVCPCVFDCSLTECSLVILVNFEYIVMLIVISNSNYHVCIFALVTFVYKSAQLI